MNALFVFLEPSALKKAREEASGFSNANNNNNLNNNSNQNNNNNNTSPVPPIPNRSMRGPPPARKLIKKKINKTWMNTKKINNKNKQQK